jgi:RNA polymerase sigma-70 factor, ECF subfamily
MSAVEPDVQVAEAYREHRSYLVNLAFRMLGDIGEAEDVVQEAFSRLWRSGMDGIDDERGWLIVVTSRLCLDHIRSARSRRQRPEPVGAGWSGLAAAPRADSDPADRVTLDDSVRLALLVVLERLSPAERVVFVLHDIFQMPFDAIAETVGRTPPTCRQLARRARHKIGADDGRGKFEVAASQHRLVTERFIAACANGDLDGLLEVLDPAVSGDVDIPARRVVVGAERVARNLLFYWGRRSMLVSQLVGDQPSVLAFVDRRLAGVLMLTIDRDRITKIHVVVDPSKLAFLRTQLGPASALS